jgi:hypothetical protein
LNTDPLDDSLVLNFVPELLLLAIQQSSMGNRIDEPAAYLLGRCGLFADGSLTDAGLALFKLAWVLRKSAEAEQALGQAVRQLTPIQVIEQELRGLGPVPEEGVLDLLLHHRAVPVSKTVNDLRPLFRWLNKVGVLAYSTKTKTVPSLAPAPDAALAGEVQAIAAMISPRTPFLNVVKLRRVLRPMRGVVWWADPHFGARALEELAEELEFSGISEIRILSGDQPGVLSDKSGKDFKRFIGEMGNKGVAAEWRADSRRDWHDRWLADDKTAWNVPPVNTLYKNDYSEINPASERPPLQTWWDRSAPRPL